jgi:mRNA interferase RelE/StbE
VASRAGGRHPNAVGTVVRLTNDAVEDLERLMRRGDPQVVKWAVKKMIHLERDPEAGEALVGGLMGWRKITVGDRDWRLVWRVTHDYAGAVIVDVAEVWAFGARSDAEVYEEIKGRIASAPQMPHTKALAEVLATLGRLNDDIQATPEPIEPDPPPQWLRESLLYVVRLPLDQVDGMTREAAEQVWADYTTGRGR